MMEADHERLARRQVVLLGIGHTNAHVLRMWRMNRYPDAALTCLSDYSVATYSGMLPAVLAGQIPQSQMQIDLVRLCSANGARLLTNRVTGLDLKKNEVLFADRPAVPFDVLSIGIGSRPTMKGVVVESESLLTIKPMQTFVERLTAFVSRFLINTASASPPPPLEVIVVGAGVAGVEITCCLPGFLKSILDGREFQLTLATSADKILPDAKPGTRRRVRRELDRRRVQLLTDHRVIGVNDQRVAFGSGETREFDLVVWATGATAPPLLSELGLPLDDRGFLATRDTLRTVADLPIYAVGDTGSMVEHQVPKSGVYAVRQGPILWENLRRELDGRPLKRYDPQSTFMRLINLGDGRAVGQWRGISFEGKWVKWWKDYIDQKFMDKFIPHVMAEDADDPMQCRGCGCKLGGVSLESALGALGSANIVKDDAAEIGDESNPMVASTDFFTSPVADSYLTGRIAALHSASDLIAMGADVRHALANVVVPEGDRRAQEQVLRDFLEGARREFDPLGAAIVGGHTTIGPRMEVGFSVVGKPTGALLRKSNLQPGDQLMLTKPIGIGVLLAAHMRASCRAEDYQLLMDAMLAPQSPYAKAAVACSIVAATDVTGFGLGGHLLEMVEASGVNVELRLKDVPVLSGAIAAVEQGIQSSLAPENRQLLDGIDASPEVRDSTRFDLLSDPQTCGGLLLGVPDENVDAWRQKIPPALFRPVCIGEVTGSGGKLKVVS